MASDKFVCIHSEMVKLQTTFSTEAGDLSQCATDMEQFQNEIVSDAISKFKDKIDIFRQQVTKTESDIQKETKRVCGEDGYEGGEGWQGDKAAGFVNSVFDTGEGLAGCFNSLRDDMDEINSSFDALEKKIAAVINSLKTNVETVSGFCTDNSDFTSSMNQAVSDIDS